MLAERLDQKWDHSVGIRMRLADKGRSVSFPGFFSWFCVSLFVSLRGARSPPS